MKGFSIIILALAFLLSACDKEPTPATSSAHVDLTIYSGITMIRPLSQLVNEFEQQHQVNIQIKQGASGYLYKTLTADREADIFFPGSDIYRTRSDAEDIWQNHALVGFNRIAIMVAKGNPKKITADLKQFTDPNLSVVLSSPESGAVGRASKKILENAGITNQVFDNVTYFTTDSNRIFQAIDKGHADISLNWYAASKSTKTQDKMEMIALPANVAKPIKLELNVMKFAKNPTLANQFIKYASSTHGLEVFAIYGFLTEAELTRLLSKNIEANDEN